MKPIDQIGTRRLTVKADAVAVGDRVISKAGADPYPVGPLVVARITDNNREGQRIGPRLYFTDPRIAPLLLKGATQMEVERP